MPPAPDLATVLDLASGIEKGLQQAITSLPITIQAFIQRQNANLPKERVDIQFTQGEWTGHLQRDKSRTLRRAAWRYALVIEVTTRRTDEDPDRHGRIRGSILAMMQSGDTFGPQNFPYHVLSTVFESGVTPSLSEKEHHDVSQLHFHGIASVRADAWP